MATLADLRANIRTYLARDDINSEIDRAINRAIAFYSSKRFWFNESTGTFSTVADQQSYGTSDGLPSQMGEIDVVTLTNASNYTYSLIPRTYPYIQEVNTSGSTYTGYPADWAWYQEKLYLYPTPDQAYTITVSYMNEYSDLSADGDSNDFTNNASDLIEMRACWWLADNMLMSFQHADRFKQHELDELRSLENKTRKLTTTARIRATNF